MLCFQDLARVFRRASGHLRLTGQASNMQAGSGSLENIFSLRLDVPVSEGPLHNLLYLHGDVMPRHTEVRRDVGMKPRAIVHLRRASRCED